MMKVPNSILPLIDKYVLFQKLLLPPTVLSHEHSEELLLGERKSISILIRLEYFLWDITKLSSHSCAPRVGLIEKMRIQHCKVKGICSPQNHRNID